MYFPDDPNGQGTNTGPAVHCVGTANNDSLGAETGNGIYSVMADCSERVYRGWIGSPTGIYHYQQRGHNFICGFSWQNPGHEPGLFTTQEDNESAWTGEVREVIGSLQRLSFSRQC